MSFSLREVARLDFGKNFLEKSRIPIRLIFAPKLREFYRFAIRYFRHPVRNPINSALNRIGNLCLDIDGYLFFYSFRGGTIFPQTSESAR